MSASYTKQKNLQIRCRIPRLLFGRAMPESRANGPATIALEASVQSRKIGPRPLITFN